MERDPDVDWQLRHHRGRRHATRSHRAHRATARRSTPTVAPRGVRRGVRRCRTRPCPHRHRAGRSGRDRGSQFGALPGGGLRGDAVGRRSGAAQHQASRRPASRDPARLRRTAAVRRSRARRPCGGCRTDRVHGPARVRRLLPARAGPPGRAAGRPARTAAVHVRLHRISQGRPPRTFREDVDRAGVHTARRSGGTALHRRRPAALSRRGRGRRGRGARRAERCGAVRIRRPGARTARVGRGHQGALPGNGPAYAHPRYVAFLDKLPMSGTGKVDKNKLARLVAEEGARSTWER